eukprot:209962-Chlamydomonas_euryale.AAC.1
MGVEPPAGGARSVALERLVRRKLPSVCLTKAATSIPADRIAILGAIAQVRVGCRIGGGRETAGNSCNARLASAKSCSRICLKVFKK